MWREVGCIENGERGPDIGVGTEGALPHSRCKEIDLWPVLSFSHGPAPPPPHYHRHTDSHTFTLGSNLNVAALEMFSNPRVLLPLWCSFQMILYEF